MGTQQATISQFLLLDSCKNAHCSPIGYEEPRDLRTRGMYGPLGFHNVCTNREGLENRTTQETNAGSDWQDRAMACETNKNGTMRKQGSGRHGKSSAQGRRVRGPSAQTREDAPLCLSLIGNPCSRVGVAVRIVPRQSTSGVVVSASVTVTASASVSDASVSDAASASVPPAVSVPASAAVSVPASAAVSATASVPASAAARDAARQFVFRVVVRFVIRA